MTKLSMKYFSFDKIQYLYDQGVDEDFMFFPESMLEPDLKIAG